MDTIFFHRILLAEGRAGCAPEWLVLERSVSNSTADAGGNAGLMTAG